MNCMTCTYHLTCWMDGKLCKLFMASVKKLARRYTEYPVDLAIKGQFDSLECEREIMAMLCHLKFCSFNNPRENITAKSLDLLVWLLNRCSRAIDVYLDWIWSTHRNVQAEWLCSWLIKSHWILQDYWDKSRTRDENVTKVNQHVQFGINYFLYMSSLLWPFNQCHLLFNTFQ